MGLFEKIFGTHSEKELKKIAPIVDAIEALDDKMQALSDEELKAVILEALAEKPDGHAFGGSLEKQKEDKTEKLCMAQIGG